MKISVLDKGSIELLDHMGSDLMVVNTARVSFDKFHEMFDEKDDTKLIKYLAEHNHWSPFAHPKIHLRIKMPIFVHRQWDKTRVGFDRNEVSRRYVDYEPEFYNPIAWRGRPEKGIKQGSGAPIGKEGLVDVTQGLVSAIYDATVSHAKDEYNYLLNNGVAPEQARIVLPVASYTEFIETGSLIGYARMYNLRSKEDAQWEIRQYADALNDIMVSLFPVSWSYLKDKEALPEENTLEQRVSSIEEILKSIRDKKYTEARQVDRIKQDCCGGMPQTGYCNVCGCVYLQDEMKPCVYHM